MRNDYLQLFYLFGAFCLLHVNANSYETDDAVIIEGKRQIINIFF